MNDPSQIQVLVVEGDSPQNRELDDYLRGRGYKVRRVPSAEEAASFLKDRDPSLPCVVLIDIRPSDGKGFDVLRAVQKSPPGVGAVMVIGNADLKAAVESLNEGASATLQKPFDMNEVGIVLEKVVEKQKLVIENINLVRRLKEMNLDLERAVQEKTSELKTKNLVLLEIVEKLKVLNEMKSRFVANASHELQTPITSILGFASMLLDYWEKIDRDQVIKFLQVIRDESQRLTKTSRDLLDLSHIQEGSMQVEIKELDLPDIVAKVAESMKMVKDTVRIVSDFDEGSRVIRSDEDKVRRIFTNLVGNAVKFSPDGSAVRVRARSRGRIVVISVIDDGPGVPEDKRDKIFEPFYRVRDETGKAVRGTGLGLAIVKATVEALGGVIRVEGTRGKGSDFTFVLPKEVGEANGKEQRSAAGAERSPGR